VLSTHVKKLELTMGLFRMDVKILMGLHLVGKWGTIFNEISTILFIKAANLFVGYLRFPLFCRLIKSSSGFELATVNNVF
jgi:hypothetical protein